MTETGSQSTVSDLPALEKRLRAFASGHGCWIYLEAEGGVEWACVDEDGEVHWRGQAPAFDALTELRAFSEAGELRAWSSASGMQVRERRDIPPERENGVPPVANRLLLIGTSAVDVGGGWSEVREERGFRFMIPAVVTDDDLPLALEVAYLVEADKVGIARPVAARFVAMWTNAAVLDRGAHTLERSL